VQQNKLSKSRDANGSINSLAVEQTNESLLLVLLPRTHDFKSGTMPFARQGVPTVIVSKKTIARPCHSVQESHNFERLPIDKREHFDVPVADDEQAARVGRHRFRVMI